MTIDLLKQLQDLQVVRNDQKRKQEKQTNDKTCIFSSPSKSHNRVKLQLVHLKELEMKWW